MKRNVFVLSTILVFIVASTPFSAKKVVVPLDMPTIQKAIDSVNEGDTVFVSNGVYKETIYLRDKCVLIGQDWEKTIISGNRKKPAVTLENGSVIKNFTIENGKTGILCKNVKAVIEHNIIRANKGSAIHVLLTLPTIRNNIITKNRGSGIFCESVRALNAAIEHNIIAQNHKSGILLQGRTQVVIENNIIYKNNEYGIYVSPDAVKSRIAYNNIFGNRQPFSREAFIDKTNISKDPLLSETLSGSYVFLSSGDNPLKGLGKNKKDIGPIDEQKLQSMNIDTDNDGVADVKDLCTNDAEDIDGYQDEDGCPDFDNDADAIYDSNDKCLNEPEDYDGFVDNDGCPDEDNDGDGIADNADKCPMQPETKNGFADEDGCPDEAPPNKK